MATLELHATHQDFDTVSNSGTCDGDASTQYSQSDSDESSDAGDAVVPLEYITIDSVQWSQGPKRSRLDAAERKERHRLDQKRFRSRKRQHICDLRSTRATLEVQFQLLQAHMEARALNEENRLLRHNIAAKEAERETQTCSRQSRASLAPDDLHALMDLLGGPRDSVDPFMCTGTIAL